MMKRPYRTILHAALVVAMGVTSLATAAIADAKASPIYGADRLSSNNGVTLNEDFINGTPYNTFNRFRDNISLCDEMGYVVNGKCTDNTYMDERDFLTVRKIGTANADGTVSITNPAAPGTKPQKFHDYTANDLKEGDVVRAYIFVHNNASTIENDDRYTAKDVRVSLATQAGRLLATIKAKNAYVEQPAQTGVTNNEATFEDDASVQLPAGLQLSIFKRNNSAVNGYVSHCSSYANNVCVNEIIGNPMTLGSTFTLSGNTFTYNKGNMVGSKPNVVFLVVDMVVSKGNGDNNTGNRETPGTYQQCVQGNTIARLVWDNAQAGDTITLYHYPQGTSTEDQSRVYTFTVNSVYGSVDHQALRNAAGQALTLKPGDRIKWRVGKGDRQSVWYEATIQDCANLQDNLHLGVMPACADPTFNPTFYWNTAGVNKVLEVSTDPTFKTYFTKDVSNLTQTTGPDGFRYFEPYSKTLTFEGDTTYYWRLRVDGKVYPGPSFKVPKCVQKDCIDNGYHGPDDTCTDEGEIIEHPGTECLPGVCACVDVVADPGAAGDYNVVNYTTTISNKSTTSQTVTKRAEIFNLRPDGKKGYSISKASEYVRGVGQVDGVVFDDTCTNGKNSEGANCDPKEQGSFQLTGNVKVVPKPAANRSSFAGADSNPIGADFSAFVKDQRNPIIVTNLYPGDAVDLVVTGVARTSLPGKEFAADTQSVDYNYFWKSPSNNGVGALTIARPFLLTVNDGDVLTSAIMKGFSDFATVYKNVFGIGTGISGRDIPTTSGQVSSTNLGFSSNLSGLTIVQAQNKTAGSLVNISSEGDFGKLNIRPDQTRIFSTKNQNLEFGAKGVNSSVQLANRSTIYVEKGNVTINSDILYASGSQTPSFALVVNNGDIFIDPSVKELDGVFVVLGTGRIRATSDWKNYYDVQKQQPQALVVNGALYGNIDDLIPSRPNVGRLSNDTSTLVKSSGIAINFDGRIYSFPPPGLKEIVGGVYELLRTQQN